MRFAGFQEYPMFHTSDGRKVIENLDEFDDAREVVAGLAAEYQACERPDYVSLCQSSCCLHTISADAVDLCCLGMQCKHVLFVTPSACTIFCRCCVQQHCVYTCCILVMLPATHIFRGHLCHCQDSSSCHRKHNQPVCVCAD